MDVVFVCCFLNIKEDEQSNPTNTNNTVREMSLDGFVFQPLAIKRPQDCALMP